MLRSMFTAISALNLHQSYLDVVASNLANANTVGYKADRVLFEDQFAQTLSPGSSPSNEMGGTNPIQVGLGVKLGFVSPDFTQGMLQSTGRNLDMAVQGDGFFVYKNGGQQIYSREGAMSFDSNGYLINTATGMRVQGWTANNGSVDTNLPVGDITVQTDHTVASATKNVTIDGNLNTETKTTDDPIPTTMGVYNSLGVLHTVTVNFTRTGDNTWDWKIDPADGAGGGTLTFNSDGQYFCQHHRHQYCYPRQHRRERHQYEGGPEQPDHAFHRKQRLSLRAGRPAPRNRLGRLHLGQ